MMAKCKICKSEYQKRSITHKTCSPECAQEFVKRARTKQYWEDRARLKTRSDWLKEAQQAFNAWVRERDKYLPCISCGRYHDGQYHAGHYRSVGAAPELRFEPLNVHKQCAPCNNHKSGNAIEYRIGLIQRIGESTVKWLEGPHEPKKYTIEDAKQIKAEYREKLRGLKLTGEHSRACAFGGFDATETN